MERKSKRPWYTEFTQGTRNKVNREQNGACAVCGSTEHNLEYHHNLPYSHGGTRDRHNCIGACPECHSFLDRMALSYGIYLNPVDMTPDTEYELPKKRRRK